MPPRSSFASILPDLEGEVFFAVLDVALDIGNQLLLGSDPISVPVKRSVIRYAILLPEASITGYDRYSQLRFNGARLLERFELVRGVEWHEIYGAHRWNHYIDLTVP